MPLARPCTTTHLYITLLDRIGPSSLLTALNPSYIYYTYSYIYKIGVSSFPHFFYFMQPPVTVALKPVSHIILSCS